MSVVRILTKKLDNQATRVYSVNTMKKEIIHITLGRRKTRVLEFYAHGTPFKPKRVEDKTRYKRKAKHPKQDY